MGYVDDEKRFSAVDCWVGVAPWNCNLWVWVRILLEVSFFFLRNFLSSTVADPFLLYLSASLQGGVTPIEPVQTFPTAVKILDRPK